MIFLLFGSPLWFFLFLTILIVADIFALESEDYGWVATVGFVIFCGFILIWGDISPLFKWLTASPWNFIGSIGGYLFMSVFWGGLFEWKLHLNRKIVAHKVKVADHKALSSNNYTREYDMSWLSPAKNKSLIIKNMTWWPVAMLRTFFRDLFLIMYNLIAEKLERMSTKEAQKAGIQIDDT